MGLFEDENGNIPRLIRKKLLYGLRLGDFLRNLYEDDLQSAAARRENSELLHGNEIPISKFDDHELHIAEHRRAALEYSYFKLRSTNPERAAVLERHIAAHEEMKGKNENGTYDTSDT